MIKLKAIHLQAQRLLDSLEEFLEETIMSLSTFRHLPREALTTDLKRLTRVVRIWAARIILKSEEGSTRKVRLQSRSGRREAHCNIREDNVSPSSLEVIAFSENLRGSLGFLISCWWPEMKYRWCTNELLLLNSDSICSQDSNNFDLTSHGILLFPSQSWYFLLTSRVQLHTDLVKNYLFFSCLQHQTRTL